jgi:formylglycine-generating enzyme required for sulfatase activity
VILKELRAKTLAEGEQISDARAEQIEAEVLRPWREYAKKKADFAETVAKFVAEVDIRHSLTAADWAELRQLKDLWKLKQSDVEEILRRYGLNPATILLSAEEIDRQLAEVAAQIRDKADAERLAKEPAQKRKEPELQPLSVSTAVVEQEARQGLRGLLGPKWRIDNRTLQVQGYRERLADGVELTMVQIPAGSFQMGSPSDEPVRYGDEGPQHQVQLQGFFMGQTPITQAQWQVVAGLQKLQRELSSDLARFKGLHRPVESVLWDEAIEFCQRLSQRFGRAYTLPNEAQWEYACRAGTTTPFHFGATLKPDLATYDGNYTYGDGPKGVFRHETTAVASFAANPWGLYDMHGNVREWCLDQWHGNYQGAPADGSAWLDSDVNKDSKRLLRGGSWHGRPAYCRSDYRDGNHPDYRNASIGFRVCCLPQGRSSLPLIS